MSSKSGTGGSISKQISSSGGVMSLASTPVGTTSMCGMRIFPLSIALYVYLNVQYWIIGLVYILRVIANVRLFRYQAMHIHE